MNVVALHKWELCTMDLVLTISNVLYAAMYNILIGNKNPLKPFFHLVEFGGKKWKN